MLLFKHSLIKVAASQIPQRIDNYIANNLKNYSRTAVKNLCTTRKLLVNDERIKASYIVKSNDEIDILLPYATSNKNIQAVNIPLDILFEDEHIIVINKVAGMAVHPGLGDYNNTLLNAVIHHCQSDEIYVAHRLDKHTSGAIVFAKNTQALINLQKQFIEHSVERTYYCLVWGELQQDAGIIDTYIGRNPANEKLIQVAPADSFGKRAITHYELQKQYKHAALVKCMLKTGRTHQIRIHMQHLGHPLVSDNRYPNTLVPVEKEMMEASTRLMPHQALHAQTLGFIHPVTLKPHSFNVPFPLHFSQLNDYFLSQNIPTPAYAELSF